MARADLATPFMQGLQIGANLMTNLQKIRQEERQRESTVQTEQLKQSVEMMKASMDQQKKVADVALQFVANEKVMAPQAKVDTFNRSILPFLNSLAPEGGQIQPLTAWNSEASQLAKAMQEVNSLPEDVPQDVRSQAMAEHLATYGLGEQALKQQQETLKPQSLDQRTAGVLTDEEVRTKAMAGTEPKNTQVMTDVEMDDQGTKGAFEKDPATGEWKLITSGGKELKGRAKPEGLRPLPADTAGKLSAAQSALNMLHDPAMESILYKVDSRGKKTINTSGFREAKGALGLGMGAPYTAKGQQVNRLLIALKEAILRPVSGAALSETDIKETERRLDPNRVFKDPAVLAENLKWAEQQIAGFTTLVDPQGSYRELLDQERPSLSDLKQQFMSP